MSTKKELRWARVGFWSSAIFGACHGALAVLVSPAYLLAVAGWSVSAYIWALNIEQSKKQLQLGAPARSLDNMACLFCGHLIEVDNYGDDRCGCPAKPGSW